MNTQCYIQQCDVLQMDHKSNGFTGFYSTGKIYLEKEACENNECRLEKDTLSVACISRGANM